MKVKCYLVIQGKTPTSGLDRNRRRDPGTLRVTKRRPDTDSDEIAIALCLDIPDSLFIKPVLQANISVPEGSPMGGEIDTVVADNIADVIREQLGIVVHVTAERGDS